MVLSRSRSQRGAAAVEFALVSMVLLVLMGAIIQFSVWFWGFQAGSNAAREGARRYAVSPCTAGANNAIVVERLGSASAGGASVGASFSKGDGNSLAGHEAGDEVTVTVSFNVWNVTGGLLPLPQTITKSATSRVEDVEDC